MLNSKADLICATVWGTTLVYSG